MHERILVVICVVGVPCACGVTAVPAFASADASGLTCGDGVLDPGEACDGGPCCEADCTLTAAGTVCNSGNVIQCQNDAVCNGVTPECPPNPITELIDGDGCCPPGTFFMDDSDCPPLCGNGVLEPGEDCDDGNLEPGDGCDEECRSSGPLPVPAITGWGMPALALILLAAVVLKFHRRHARGH